VSELFDPRDRRYLYPFTNCTNCGPRYTIIESLPYDRPRSSMKAFTMCPECAAEYHAPANRRFHAQPNACPECGPHVELWNPRGKILATRSEALEQAAQAVLAGRILAVKGLGGFHLMCLASDSAAVTHLRDRKHREAKPLAVMCPTLERSWHLQHVPT
jgi:hydrogenase maturation protein HypF